MLRDSPSTSMVRSMMLPWRLCGNGGTASTGQRSRSYCSNHCAQTRSERGPLLVGSQPRAMRTGHDLGDLVRGAHRDRRADHPEEQADLLGEVDRRVTVVDLGAGVRERVGGGAEHGAVLGVERALGRVEPHTDPQSVERLHVARRQLDAPCGRKLRGGRRQHPDQEVEVVRAARDRPEDVDVGVGGASTDVVEVPALGHHAEARLQPEDTAAVRRDADRSADVGPELEAGETGGHCGRRPPRGSTRDVTDVPRVAAAAEDLVEGLDVT